MIIRGKKLLSLLLTGILTAIFWASPCQAAAGKKNTEKPKQDILDTVVSFKNTDTEPLLTVIRETTVHYPHADLFGTEAALDRYEALQEYESKGSLQFIKNGKINRSALEKQVKANNAAYLAARDKNSTRYTEMTDKDFSLVFNVVADTLDGRLKGSDIYQLDRNLSRLTLLNTTDAYNGAVTCDDIRMTINLKACRHTGGDEKVKLTAAHETIHLLQYASDREKEQEGYDLNAGFQYRWEDLEVNPLYNNWFIEASAEKLSQLSFPDREKKHDMYREFVKTLDSLTLSVFLAENVEGDTVPALNCQPDLAAFFRLFDAQTREEKSEIINMMYAYNLVYDANKTNARLEKAKDFFEKAGVTDTETYRREVCTASALTFAKNFYRTLAEKLVTAKNITLRDLFILLMLEEADLNRVGVNMLNSSYEYGTLKRTDRFVDGYTEIQEAFFGLVSESTGISEAELYRAFDDFYKSYNYEFTVDTALLSKEEQAFVADILDTRTAVRPYDNIFTFKK